MAFHPNASARATYPSRSQPSMVSRVWPSRFTSTITVRLSSPDQPACWNASQIEPSAISESPQSTHTLYGNRSRCLPASARPTPTGRPWPSEPVATSVGGMRGVGWPSSLLSRLRKVSSSSSVIAPTALSIA